MIFAVLIGVYAAGDINQSDQIFLPFSCCFMFVNGSNVEGFFHCLY